MANWNVLKAAVANIINANGNQEITGQLLQNVLNNIITNVGENATFAGIATLDTNPGAPDGPVFYLATTAGVYPNFNGLEVLDGEAIIFLWNNSAWTKKVTGFATQEKMQELEENTNEKLSQLGSKAKGISYFKDYISKGVNINTFFKELYIEGLDENIEYCLRTLRYNPDVNTYQINIGTSEKSVIELNFSVAESENYATAKKGTINAYMVIANTEWLDKSSNYLFGNTDTSLTTLDISKASDISLSPYIANELLKYEYSADYKDNALKELYVVGGSKKSLQFEAKKKTDGNVYLKLVDDSGAVVSYVGLAEDKCNDVIFLKQNENSGVSAYAVVDVKKIPLDDDNYYRYKLEWDYFNLSLNPRICEYLNQTENEKKVNTLGLVKPKYFANDLDVYFKELYIEGLDDNTEYCLRTFGWNSNGYFQINIGNSNGNVIELPIFNGNFAYNEKGGIKAWVVLQNIENINSYLIFANSDVEKSKLNKVNATTLSQSPYVKEKIEEERKGEAYLLSASYNGYSLPKNPASLKILSIGNSFADQPLSTLIKWLNNLGITQVTYGIVSKSGGTLEQHYNGLYTTYDAYFRTTENKDGVQKDWVYSNPETKEVGTIQIKLIDAFSYTDWDIITFHQQSGNSGKWETIEPYLPKLMEAARYYCPNAGVKIAWQQTWAFAKGYGGLSSYGTQMDMFNAIVDCSKKVAEIFGVDLIIPNGVVMQHLRSIPNSFWGDKVLNIKGGDEWTSESPSADFCEDGLHPNGFAEYCLGATFVQVLINSCFNKTIRNSNVSMGYASGDFAKVARQCVLKAVGNRFSLSEINITDKLE